MTESEVREQMVRLARSLFVRGFSVGSSGNISVRLEDGYLMTPTNSCLGTLEPEKLSKMSLAGVHIAGDAPSKEVSLHLAFYQSRPGTGAVVHLHSTHATALSCLTDLDPDDCLPSLTPYVVMRVGRVRLLDYVMPGDEAAGQMIRALDGAYGAVLLANHGPVVAGRDLSAAVYAAEELEETARLLLLLRGLPARTLTAAQVAELERRFG